MLMQYDNSEVVKELQERIKKLEKELGIKA
ncbi:transcription factor, partial [Thermococci archaeon]